MSWTSRLLREPLVLMVALGALVFALGRWHADPAADPKTIQVTDDVRAQLAAEIETRTGRAPDEAALERAVQGWIDAELLYREGLALGLAEHDPVVRRRIVQKMETIQHSLEPIGEPTDEQLRAFVEANAERYAAERRYDFVQVVRPKSEDPDGTIAAADLEALRGGADPKSLGPRVGTSRRFALASVARTFGPDFAAAVRDAEVGAWTRVELPEAWILLRVDGVASAGAPDLEANAGRIRADWEAERRREVQRAALDRLRAQYRIIEETP